MNNPIVRRIDVGVAQGWVKLSDTRLIADVTMQAVTAFQISLRADGGPGALLTSNIFRMEGVDLSRLEISTTATGPVGFIIIGNSRD